MPIDRGAIDAQLRDIGEGERWWEQREFRELPYILHAGERIQGLATGKLIARRGPSLLPSGTWLVVVTTERIICLKQQRFGRKQVDMPFGQITALQHGSRLNSYQFAVTAQQRKYRIRIAKADAFRIIGALAPLLQQTSQRTAIGPAWIPGLGALPGVAGIVSKVSIMASPDLVSRADLARLEATVEGLEGDLERLQQQVNFLESLLQKRSEEAFTAARQVTGVAGIDGDL